MVVIMIVVVVVIVDMAVLVLVLVGAVVEGGGVLVFLLLARFWDVRPPLPGYLAVVPALALAGLMLGAFGLALSSLVRQLENFAGVMNFVIFPMFFASSALYPLWRLRESSVLLHDIAAANPFTHAVELIRFALYLEVNWLALAVTLGCLTAFLGGAIYAYDPSKGLIGRWGGPGSSPT